MHVHLFLLFRTWMFTSYVSSSCKRQTYITYIFLEMVQRVVIMDLMAYNWCFIAEFGPSFRKVENLCVARENKPFYFDKKWRGIIQCWRTSVYTYLLDTDSIYNRRNRVRKSSSTCQHGGLKDPSHSFVSLAHRVLACSHSSSRASIPALRWPTRPSVSAIPPYWSCRTNESYCQLRSSVLSFPFISSWSIVSF